MIITSWPSPPISHWKKGKCTISSSNMSLAPSWPKIRTIFFSQAHNNVPRETWGTHQNPLKNPKIRPHTDAQELSKSHGGIPRWPPPASARPELFRFPKAPQETFETPQCPSPRSRFHFQPFRFSQLFQPNPAIPQSCNHPSLRQRNVWSDSSRNFILGFPLELMTSIRISGFTWGIASVAPNTTLFGTAYADLTQKSIFWESLSVW